MSAGAKVAQRLGCRLVLLALLATTGGCFTTLAWGGDPFDDDDDHSRRQANRHDEGPSLWESLALTPFTVVLDVVTMPVQLFLLSDDDDDDSGSGRDRSRAATGSPNTPGTTLRSH